MPLAPKLREHKVVPFWTLPDKYGRPYNLARKRGQAHLLLLICAPGVDPAPFLHTIAPALVEMRTLPAQGIVVVASEDAAARLGTLPSTLLVDAEGKVRDRYLPAEAVAGLFALDRYGDLYHQWLVQDLAELPPADEVSGWMQAISMQCSV